MVPCAGGLGNAEFATATYRRPQEHSLGEEGQRLVLELEMKTIANVGLVRGGGATKKWGAGPDIPSQPYWNATWALCSLPQGRLPKCREVHPPAGHFTSQASSGCLSIHHRQATCGRSGVRLWDTDSRWVWQHAPPCYLPCPICCPLPSPPSYCAVADIPGLVAGAHRNIGLGHAFLRHIERCKSIVFVVDLAQPHPLQQVALLQFELNAHLPGLGERPAAIVANKMDAEGAAEAARALACSTRMLVVPVSGLHKWNTPHLKRLILSLHTRTAAVQHSTQLATALTK